MKTLSKPIALALLLGVAPFTASANLMTDIQPVFEFMSPGETRTVEHSFAEIPGEQEAVHGWLTLAFADDFDGHEEVATISFADFSTSEEVDGSIWSILTYDWVTYGLTINAIADLNADGNLSVTVSSSGGSSDFWWKKSILTVWTRESSVPEPSALFLMGSGLLAMSLVARRRRLQGRS